jgi:hypothetical protein
VNWAVLTLGGSFPRQTAADGAQPGQHDGRAQQHRDHAAEDQPSPVEAHGCFLLERRYSAPHTLGEMAARSMGSKG